MAEGAPKLATSLHAGQVLVTRAGDLWRWDEWSPPAMPSAAAQRLAQKNWLAELDAELDDKRRERSRQKADVDIRRGPETARVTEREARGRPHGAEVDTARRPWGTGIALQRPRGGTCRGSSLAEAEAIRADAEKALAEAGDEVVAAGAAEKQSLLTAMREEHDEARMKLATFEQAARMRMGGGAQCPGEFGQLAAPAARRGDAIGDSGQRASEIAVQWTRSVRRRVAARRAAVDEQIAGARG